MDSTQEPSAWERFRASFGRRGLAFLLALAVEALLVLLFLALAPALLPTDRSSPPIFGFDIDSGDPVQPRSKAETRAERPRGREEPAARPPVPEPPEVEPPPPVEYPPEVIWLSRRDYAASDLANARSQPGPRASGEGPPAAPDSEQVAGHGPNGEPLYAAEWHTRPTNAQLNTYIPERARGRSGWGLIACRTVDNFRVEDCQELGEAPRGSGLSGAVRQAAWQFRVRPPRVGGKSMVGAWVSIRIDYTITNAN